MTKGFLLCAIVGATLLAGCNYADRERDEPSEPLVITIDPVAASAIAVDTVRFVPAPAVNFPAQVRPDPNHLVLVTTLRFGRVANLAEPGHVLPGDTIAVIDPPQEADVGVDPILGNVHGDWRPWRQPGQFVGTGDTIGVIVEDGYWLAIGFVPNLESVAVHEDDPATVRLGDSSIAVSLGRVEWVHRVGARMRYDAEVAVEFETLDHWADPGRTADITVIPSGPTDSVAAVVPQAVAHMAQGAAVFIPLGPDRYEVRWIFTGPATHDMITVPFDLDAGTLVASSVLEALASALRDSLEQRATKAVADSTD